jgi:hypothetical protein
VLEGADRGWEVSQWRALVGFIFIRRLGYKLKDREGVWVETLQRCVLYLALRRSYERERNIEEAGGAIRGRLSRIESLIPHVTPDAEL